MSINKYKFKHFSSNPMFVYWHFKRLVFLKLKYFFNMIQLLWVQLSFHPTNRECSINGLFFFYSNFCVNFTFPGYISLSDELNEFQSCRRLKLILRLVFSLRILLAKNFLMLVRIESHVELRHLTLQRGYTTAAWIDFLFVVSLCLSPPPTPQGKNDLKPI